MSKVCEHNERVWISDKINPNYQDVKIGIKTKCRECGVIGYEIYNFSTFEVGE